MEKPGKIVSYYTDSNKHKGWVYLTKKEYTNGIKSWLKSGNKIQYTDGKTIQVFTWKNRKDLKKLLMEQK